jgi:Ni/Fe-hydrogenase b-type cytochrome subunit
VNPSAERRPASRHALATRLWHWVNLLSFVVLFMSGLNISNAHPHLYWGKWGFSPEAAWLSVPRFPGWSTIPGYYSLAAARDWHILFAWVFAVGLLLYMLASLANRHFRRDLVTGRREWHLRVFAAEIREYLRFNFAHTGGKYGSMQKLTYALVVFILLPLMIFTGMAMSPGMDAAWPWLLDVFGGRQSARSLHFIAAWLLAAFTLVHLLLVLLTGPFGQLRAMIVGGRADEAT